MIRSREHMHNRRTFLAATNETRNSCVDAKAGRDVYDEVADPVARSGQDLLPYRPADGLRTCSAYMGPRFDALLNTRDEL